MNSTLRNALSLESSSVDLDDGVSLESGHLELTEAALSLENIDLQLSVLGDAQDKAMSLESYLDEADETKVDAAALDISMEALGVSLEADTPLLEDKRTGIKAFIKKVWNAIKRAIKAVVSTFKDFFKKLFDNVTRLQKKVDQMENDLETMVKEKQINASEQGQPFDVPQSVAEALVVGNVFSNEKINDGKVQVNNIVGHLRDITEHTTSTYIALEDHLSKWKDGQSEDGLTQLKLGKSGAEVFRAVVTMEDSTLPGEKELQLVYPGMDPGKTSEFTPQHYQFYGRLSPSKSARSRKLKSTTMQSLTIDEVREHIRTLKSFLDVIFGNRKNVDKLAKQRESFNKAADQWVSNLEKGRIGKFISKMQLRQHMNMIRQNGQQTVSVLNRYLYTYCLNMYKFVNVSITSFEGDMKTSR